MSAKPTPDDLKTLLFKAVRLYLNESPRIGGTLAKEWAVSTRIAIHLAQTKQVRGWEKRLNILVDAEYIQKGLGGDLKMNLANGRAMKPDIILHRRGAKSSRYNWIACEVKLYAKGKPPSRVQEGDRQKLQALRKQFKYRVGIWLSVPRSGDDHVAYYAEVERDGAIGPVQAVPQR